MTTDGRSPRLVVLDDPARPMFWLHSYEFDDHLYFKLSEYESDIYVDLEY